MAKPVETSPAADVGEGGPSDGALALRARDGDRAAFETLVRRYQRPVFGLALRMLRRREDARDAAQEVFVKAWTNLPSYDPARAFAPWLLTIARNQVRDSLRRRKVRKGDVAEAEPADLLARLPDRGPGAQRELETAEETLAIEEALGDLEDKYREVVVLHHIGGRSVAEIAEIVERPQGTVMTWLYRGRAQLKDVLERKGVRA